ncbi:rRNA maturation RNase YbeY [Syntrophomonas palmitatica]|uniref:rRNA maturation RNase YbeY n=1 Tax=Syntrophomonas palmitatica TaxID=402877 RepID=UPI0009FAB8D0|nr:rRNA maturation RNase YbeY [Syntrophomonas palmitatica]
MEAMIINQQNKIVYTREMQQVIMTVINAVAKLVRLPKNTEVSVMVVDNSYIQELNFIYRQQNRPTDVLSFAMNELGEDEPDYDFGGDVNVLGDIVISLEQAQVQSEEYGHSLNRELGYLVAHGMLHLLGYDHETEDEKKLMRNLEDKIMHSVKLER